MKKQIRTKAAASAAADNNFSGSACNSLPATALHSGLYFCRITDASGPRLVTKLIISR